VRFAYNSNGLKQHSMADAIVLLADLGYDAIELALQREHLHPLEASVAELRAVRDMLEAAGLGIVCGAGVPNALGEERFEPSLFHPDPAGRALRRRYLRACLEAAGALGSEILVTCSGSLQPGVDPAEAWDWLVEGLGETCGRAGELGLRLAVEPEPGHFVETLDDYRRLRSDLGDLNLGLTLDVGHVYCTEAEPVHLEIARVLREERLLHVQIEDMRGRRHEHLPFGEGEIDFPPIIRTLLEAGYEGYVGVELSRDSHRAAELASRSLVFLRAAGSGQRAAAGRDE
jgi:L-ribulose-5-phosphate 3-epimerase